MNPIDRSAKRRSDLWCSDEEPCGYPRGFSWENAKESSTWNEADCTEVNDFIKGLRPGVPPLALAEPHGPPISSGWPASWLKSALRRSL